MNALILAAGVGTSGPVGELPLHRFDKTVAVNVGSAFVLLKHALPLLRRGAAEDTDHGAKIIALASITGVYVEPGLAAYGASKAALMSLIETLNAEESSGGVTATAIAPAYVDTDMSAWVQDRMLPDSMISVADIVEIAAMLLRLGRTASIGRIVVSRSGANGYAA
jgi:NAD(P)-dependent dehydrogenase (short-subunit alcohol dehydrogenase family)